MDEATVQKESLVLSYLELRKSIGTLGIALPFVVALGKMVFENPGILPSISAYYYSSMGNVFVGILCAISVFLWSYRGYEAKDIVAGHVAALFGVGVALFPTAPEMNATSVMQFISYLHAFCAGGFFLSLSYFALVLFRKTNPNGAMTRMKKIRNIVYILCGATIIVCVALVAGSHFASDAVRADFHSTFWLESIAILAFGISWFVKGEAILKDD